MDDFRDSLGAKLRVGDLIVAGIIYNKNSTPAVGVFKVVKLLNETSGLRKHLAPRVQIESIDNTSTGTSQYRYCDSVYRLDALAVRTDQLLEEHS